MQFALSFTALLACILVTLSSMDNVQALPSRRSDNIVTLPLKRLHSGTRDDVHPQVVSTTAPAMIGNRDNEFDLWFTLVHSFYSSI